MDKVIRRTVTARKQAQNKLFRAKQQNELSERKEALRAQKDYRRTLTDRLRASREARWEDWQKGPLAPKRDAGLAATTYGSIDPSALQPPKIPNSQRSKHIMIAAGDRVCLMRGREKGKVTEVTAVNEDSETVTLKDTNMADINVPEWAKVSMNLKGDVMPQAIPVPIDDVRLVVAITDPDETTTRDCLIQHTYASGPSIDRPRWSKLPKFTRYISGMDMAIPWPKDHEADFKNEESDSIRGHVQEATFAPSIEVTPFPSSVMDELRNKYSRFRTRHDPEYVREKVMEEYRQQYLASQSLLTPAGEYNKMMAEKSIEAKKATLEPNGEVRMDEDTSAFISRFLEGQKLAQGPAASKSS